MLGGDQRLTLVNEQQRLVDADALDSHESAFIIIQPELWSVLANGHLR